ncbi:DUF4145 domain-containing protein [Zooshikella ganghwensis]|uniref:DUF4145 domain-containing protein n=1 Tax=Zooshikella ganghwensis TaxID=202772 RepID=A0A4P9VDW7_9GAMM|nr:DUF4145 domain-containing protein [Zooshikella ganghwensis]RDH41263.1 hypothetical protein B9G39_29595 [Zooshikella ganghwensis]
MFKRETNHRVIAAHKKSWEDRPDYEYPEFQQQDYRAHGSKTYSILECLGCEDIIFCIETYHSEWDDSPNASNLYDYYPPLFSRQKPNWYERLPIEWQDILNEIYIAIFSDCRRIALMGTRTLLDMYILKQIGDVENTFFKKLNKLQENGHITESDKEVFKNSYRCRKCLST